MCLVSVVMPAYNSEKTIEDAILSVMSQDYNDFELLIVNDGSTDGTKDIIDKFSMMESKIKVMHIENSGVSNARNTAIQQAKGEYLMFIDSDDMMRTNCISKLVQYLSDDIDLLCCGYSTITDGGKVLLDFPAVDGEWEAEDYYIAIEKLQNQKSFNMLWNKLFRTKLIMDNNIIMDTSISMGEDVIFIIDYLSVMTRKIRCVSEKLYMYRISPHGLHIACNLQQCLSRMDRTRCLEKLYVKKGYPKTGIIRTQMRTFYTMLVDSENSGEIIRKIYAMPEYKVCVEAYENLGIRFFIFHIMLKKKWSKALLFSVKVLKMLKNRNSL